MLKLRIARFMAIGFLAVFSVILGTLSYAYFFDKSPEPSSVVINLSEAGTVADFRFQVKKDFVYWFSMRFWFSENDQEERAHLRKLLGGHTLYNDGQPVEPGTATPVNLKIFTVCTGGKEVEIYSKDIDPILASWGSNNFGKNIGFHDLAKGTYRAQLVNKRAVQELSLIRTTFERAMPAKVESDPRNVKNWSDPCQR